LSPEQALGGKIDARSDLFTLGVMLYEMVTAHHPFHAPTPTATLMNIIRATPAPASNLTREVPPELDALLMRAMSKEIGARHQSAASLAADLRNVLTQLDAHAGDRGPAMLIPDDDKKSGAVWIVAGVGGAAAAALAWWLLR
jgi:serine/threonine-protein kinase